MTIAIRQPGWREVTDGEYRGYFIGGLFEDAWEEIRQRIGNLDGVTKAWGDFVADGCIWVELDTTADEKELDTQIVENIIYPCLPADMRRRNR